MYETISTSSFQPEGAQRGQEPVAAHPAPGPFTPELATSTTELFFWLLFPLGESLSPRLGFVSDFTVWAKPAPIYLCGNP